MALAEYRPPIRPARGAWLACPKRSSRPCASFAPLGEVRPWELRGCCGVARLPSQGEARRHNRVVCLCGEGAICHDLLCRRAPGANAWDSPLPQEPGVCNRGPRTPGRPVPAHAPRDVGPASGPRVGISTHGGHGGPALHDALRGHLCGASSRLRRFVQRAAHARTGRSARPGGSSRRVVTRACAGIAKQGSRDEQLSG